MRNKRVNGNIKDWELAQLMFGRNKKKEMKILKRLLRHYKVEKLCDTHSIIIDTTLNDDCGWLIPNECLE